MKRIRIAIAVVLLCGCASQKKVVTTKGGFGDTRTKEVQMIDRNTYLLTDLAPDKTYAYEKSNPVKVGGVAEQSGPLNERRFLNGLLGPNGEELKYHRAGSCCGFKTPNGFIDNMGMLDLYRVSWEGSKDTLSIYINMYDEGDLFVPVGLTARKAD